MFQNTNYTIRPCNNQIPFEMTKKLNRNYFYGLHWLRFEFGFDFVAVVYTNFRVIQSIYALPNVCLKCLANLFVFSEPIVKTKFKLLYFSNVSQMSNLYVSRLTLFSLEICTLLGVLPLISSWIYMANKQMLSWIESHSFVDNLFAKFSFAMIWWLCTCV